VHNVHVHVHNVTLKNVEITLFFISDSSTGTTKNITSTDIIKIITEIDDIEEQQKQAIFKRLEDKRTKEIADLKKLRQQEGLSIRST
jgi:hypothetical protein